MESSSVVKVGLLGGAAYLAYKYFLSPPSSAVPVVPAAGAAPAAAVPGIPPQSLDAIYAKMLTAAAAEGVSSDGAGLDAWNVYLMRAGVPGPEPAPEDVFGSLPGGERTRKYLAPEYWAKMAPFLKARGGYAGLGLFGSLSCGRYA
jgi:hypothetical protein